jgi:hypothetical protein
MTLLRFSNTYEFFFYADDMNLYLPVGSFQDCLKIQSDLDRLTAWCEDNMLPLNVNKCITLPFTRSSHPVIAFYVLNGKILERKCSMTDLGVILDSKLSFREHIDSVVNSYVWLYKALVTGIPRSLYIEGFVCHLCSLLT